VHTRPPSSYCRLGSLHGRKEKAGMRDIALKRYTDLAVFYEAAGPFLLDHEAAHCLLLGICAGLIEDPQEPMPTNYLELVAVRGNAAASSGARANQDA
jgi:hypothetical protein